jgi:hypothetical protein
MALRGPDGSMQKAVEGMEAQRTHTFIFFALGLVTLNLGLIGITWVLAVWYNALLVSEQHKVCSRRYILLLLRASRRCFALTACHLRFVYR